MLNNQDDWMGKAHVWAYRQGTDSEVIDGIWEKAGSKAKLYDKQASKKMKLLHKLGKYHNLNKLNKIVEFIYNTASSITGSWAGTSITKCHDFGCTSYAVWRTLGVDWHIDDIYEDRKYSIILVVQSDNYELYTSTVNEDIFDSFFKTYDTTFRDINERIDYLSLRRKDTQRLVLKAGDILLLNTSYYHKLKNTKKTEDPFIFISLDIDSIPESKEAIKVVNYFIHDFFVTINTHD